MHQPNNKTSWKAELTRLIKDPVELAELLQLDTHATEQIKEACSGFELRVPRPYLSRITPGDPRDPLLLQVLPQAAELTPSPGDSLDPLEEQHFSPIPGLLHKYHGRVLVVLNGSCPIHCRYCFRRHFPYQEARIGPDQWRAILDYIQADTSITEVIFSGGEPLNSTDASLARKCQDLSRISHLRRLRIHTRQPVMIPQRINEECLDWMKSTCLQIVVVLHCNHAQEIDEEVEQALAKLKSIGITLLNQAVLLKGINDKPHCLAELSERLFSCEVLPYYLHMLDPVTGASHFLVPRQKAMEIKRQLQSLVPGYLMPRFAIEEPHAKNKTTL
ncbi:MAG: EF-P beta-lysylation protein EpmB [Granulosicoccaceae bacterium]